MAHSPDPTPVSPEALRLGYQPEAYKVRGFLVFLVASAVTVIAIQAFVWQVMESLEARNVKADVPRSALTLGQQPPPPNLQPSVGHDTMDYQDLEALRKQEDSLFTKLGWTVNGQTHEAGIPAEIVRKVAEKARARSAGPPVPPTTTGQEPNTTVPGTPPAYDTNPAVRGGQRP